MRLTLCVLFLSLAVFSGCKKEPPNGSSKKNSNTMITLETKENYPVESSSILETAISLWASDNFEDAIKLFVRIDDSDHLHWSNEFALKSSREQIVSRKSEILNELKLIKKICSQVAREGDVYLENGDYSAAEGYFNSIVICGNLVINSNELAKMDGKAICKLGRIKLDSLPSRSIEK